jgi:hypothetical protein
MNTKLDIKTRRSLFSPSFVSLLIGVAVVLFLGGPSVQAQTTSTTSDSAATDAVDRTLTITATGSVSDPNGSFSVTGSVVIKSRRVIDTTSATTPALVLLDFDFSQLKGTTGSLKTQRVYVTGDNHAEEIRPLQATDTIIITAPYYESTKDPLSARSMLVTATLNFDVSTGKLTSGSITVGNNVVTSSTVGSVATTTPQ